MRSFGKYHRTLAIILALPLAVTLLTGIAANLEVPRSLLFLE
ncbi:hypothetical protein [Nostoc sp.]